jgi:two-component system response regulator HydG
MSSDRTLLVADDDPGLRESLERALSREGYRVILASDGQAALERLQAGGIDLIVTDLKMPGLTGLELLRAAKAIAPDIDVILLTAFGTVEEAVKAMKDGAYDFLTKPFRREQLLKLIDKALERRDLIEKNRALQQRLDDLLRQGSIIGGSPAFRRMMMLVEQVASSSATVLVQGESGTGKELVARAIHDRSARASKAFVAVNCAALPETLLESELFGYERGAFTGAAGRKEGRFELADGGTLFLDEVADLSPVTQPKILRVLQEGEFERLGGTRSMRVDVSRPCASGARTSRSSRSTSCASTRPRTTASSTASRTRRSAAWRPTPGPATCASWRTSSSAGWCWRAGRRWTSRTCRRRSRARRRCPRACSPSASARRWRRSSSACSTRPCA